MKNMYDDEFDVKKEVHPTKKHFFYDEVWNDTWNEYRVKLKQNRLIAAPVCIFIVLIILCSTISIIPTGYTGVKTTFGQIDPNTVQQGFNVKIPFIQGVEKVNNKQQDIKIENQIWSETMERTAIYYEDITISYSINKDKSAWIYANINDYKNTLMSYAVVSSSIKSASKELSDIDATNRNIVEPKIRQLLQESLDSKYGTPVVTIHKVSVGNIDFDESYNQAIAAKQQAQINAQQAAIENQRAVEKAEADKKVKIADAEAEAQSAKTKAEADAEVKKINAQANAEVQKVNAQAEASATKVKAEAQAEANKKLAESLTPELIKKEQIDAWDGKYPNVVTGETANMLMQIGD